MSDLTQARSYSLHNWSKQAETGVQLWRRQVPTEDAAASMTTYYDTRDAIAAEIERRAGLMVTAESVYGTVHTGYTRTNRSGEHLFYTTSGVLIGDVDDMKNRGWEFTDD